MYRLRLASPDDLDALRALIDASVRGLNDGHYSPAEVDASLVHVFGVDSQLIADGTYYAIETSGVIVAAGGWSRRRTLFGGDQMKQGADALLDPARDAARIRAFFVHPSHARRGLARRLFDECAIQARGAGFRRLELAATLPGVPLYEALGFTARHRIEVPMADGLVLTCVHMDRVL